jgi:flagellar hook-basal body complex protein FliE
MIDGISGIRPIGAGDPVGKAGGVAPAGNAEFGKVLADVAADAVTALKTSEASAIAGINGEQSLQQVVSAVMTAEQALQTAISVRDKLISAYQEISRMAI